ncbi:uncharacterized protein LOC133795941 [Humulus lupulus]|uniref:uncharacterized protein LOC133795941 n=1 Tax=Humulus lupulus TaxID=3486 RepID=UPI002B402AD3|nr:uncharacterized protein LOC133795941 [Humulus lupulus]
MNRRTFGVLCELLHVGGRVKRLQENLLANLDHVPANCTDSRWRWFENCLEALDGTYIEVQVPEVDKPRYRTRKSNIATNVLRVCSQDMKLLFVLLGWEGSASDSRVLRDDMSRPNGLKIPKGYYYLVDGGYTNGEGFLAPYRGTVYHLSEWGRNVPRNHEYFNMKHASARNVIERSFGLLKEDHEILDTVKASDQWTEWKNNLAMQMYNEWRQHTGF